MKLRKRMLSFIIAGVMAIAVIFADFSTLLSDYIVETSALENSVIFSDETYYYKVISDNEVEITGVTSAATQSSSLTVPETVSYDDTVYVITSLGERAFQYFDGDHTYTHMYYNDIYISKSITSINSETFNMANYESISTDENNRYFISDDGILFNKERTSLIRYPARKYTSKTYTVPDGVISIADYAFYGCGYLTDIDLPNGLESIGNSSFMGSGITQMTIPYGVKRLGTSSFSICKQLKSIDISSTVNYIGNNAFDHSDKLEEIMILGNIDTIHSATFSYCSSLKEVVLPTGIRKIESIAFDHCTQLEIINIPDTVESIGESAFSYCFKIKNIRISDEVDSIPPKAFYACSTLESIIIPDSVKSIGNEAFYACNNLATIIGTENSYAQTYAQNNGYEFEILSQHIDSAIVDEVDKYCTESATDYTSRVNKILASGKEWEVMQEELIKVFHNYGLNDIHEGFEERSSQNQYLQDTSTYRSNYNMLVTNQFYCSSQFDHWVMSDEPKAIAARTALYASGLIFNNELSDIFSLDPDLINHYPEAKKNKTMLKAFLQSSTKSDKVLKNAKNISKIAKGFIKILDNDGTREARATELSQKILESFNNGMDSGDFTELNNLIEKNSDFLSKNIVDCDGKVILDCPAISKALGYAANTLTFLQGTIDDFLMFMNLENEAAIYQANMKFLNTIINSNESTNAMKAAAYSLLEDVKDGYGNLSRNVLFKCFKYVKSTDEWALDFDFWKELFPNKGKFFSDMNSTYKLAVLISNLFINTGDWVKEVAYTQGYAQLSSIYSNILKKDKQRFLVNKSENNAWRFFEDYTILWQLRYNSEEQYLKMNKVKAFFDMYEIKTSNFVYKEKVVNENLSRLNDAKFVLDKEIDIPSTVQYMKKAVIHCPVDVYVYNSNEDLIITLKDGELSDVTNEYGRFAVVYNSFTEEYEKVICQSTDEELTIKMVAVDDGIVDYEFAYKNNDGNIIIQTFDKEEPSKGDVIKITTDETNSTYEIAPKGDANSVQIKNVVSLSDEYVKVNSLEVDDEEINIKDNGSALVGISVLPNNSTYKGLSWSSSDNDVAKVHNGKVIGESEGTATIYVRALDNPNAVKSIDVNVTANDYPIEIDDTITNGTVSVDKSTAKKGETVSLTVTPSNGYKLSSLVIKDEDNNDVTVNDNTFVMPKKNVTVSAVFEEKDTQTVTFENNGADVEKTYGDSPFKIDANSDGDGTITYSSNNTAVATVANDGTVTIIKKGKATITASAEATDNLKSGSASYKLTVNPKELTITGLTIENKEYDGTIDAYIKGTAILNGVLNDDNVTLTNGTAVFEDKNVGTDKTVTFSGFTLGGTKADNYTLFAQPESVTASITAKTVTINGVTATNRTYKRNDKSVTLTGGTVSGAVEGEVLTVDLSNAIGTMTDDNVGTDKAITISGVALSGTTKDNYKFVQPTYVTVTITQVTGLKVMVGTHSNGTIKLNGNTTNITDAKSGEEIFVEATANSDYRLSSLSYTGAVCGTVTITGNKFTMPGENVTVNAVFARNGGGSSVSYIERKTGGITYHVDGDYVELASADSSITKADIAVKIDGYNVTAIGENAFNSCTKLKTVTISDNVKEIKASAFWGCTSLESIVIPESVEIIAKDAFRRCSSLKEIQGYKGSAAEAFAKANKITFKALDETVTTASSESSETTSTTTVSTTATSGTTTPVTTLKIGTVNDPKIDNSGRITWSKAQNAVEYRVAKVVGNKTYYGSKTPHNYYYFDNVPNEDYKLFVYAIGADGRFTTGKTLSVKVNAVGKAAAPTVAKDGTVSWKAVKNAVKYRVIKVVNGVSYSGSDVTSTSYKFKSVPVSDYQVYVVSYGENGAKTMGDKTIVKVDKPLGFVNDVKVSADGKVTWSKSQNAISYRVVKVINGKNYYGTETKTTSYQFENLPYKDYQVYVIAYGEDNKLTVGKRTTVEVGNLGVVFDPKVDKNGKVSWSTVRGAVKYKVYKVVNGKRYYGITEDTSYTFKNVPTTDYKIYVVAFDKDGKYRVGTVKTVRAR